MSTENDHIYKINSGMPDTLDMESVLNRVKSAEDVRSDAKAADILGMGKSTLSERKGRNSLPIKELSAWARKKGISMDWLLFGDDPQHLADKVSEPTPTYTHNAIQFDLYLAISRTINEIFKEAQIKVGEEVSQDKRDHLIAYCYNQHIKNNQQTVEKETIRESVSLVL